MLCPFEVVVVYPVAGRCLRVWQCVHCEILVHLCSEVQSVLDGSFCLVQSQIDIPFLSLTTVFLTTQAETPPLRQTQYSVALVNLPSTLK